MTKITNESLLSARNAHKVILKKLEDGLITEDEICTRCFSRPKGPGLRFFCKQCFKEVSNSPTNNDGDFTYFGIEKLEGSFYEQYIKSPRQKSPPKYSCAVAGKNTP
jgi:hypothetical protein